MNRIHDMPPGVIEDLDERYPVGVLGQDAGGWGYITMGPDRDPDSVPNDGWGFLLPQYYYYVPPTATTSATTVSDSNSESDVDSSFLDFRLFYSYFEFLILFCKRAF